MGSMTKAQILDYMAKKSGLTKKAAGEFLDEFVKLAYREAKKSFVVPGLGKLVLSERKERMGRNPKTGEQMLIPAKKVVKFRIAKAAKEAILGNSK
ncbi:HU family DNA-binding protein [Melioribacteraceae bacterium 4301-Me]|uniref:HU family DNA-binding protein n=1 Tax=Pyranulibacter aquaticus TaxID=3163344 RepID=UPI0035970512